MVEVNNKRFEAAGMAFQDYEFEDGFEPAEIGMFFVFGEDRLIRPVTFRNKNDPEGEVLKGAFSVTFPFGSNTPDDAWASIGDRDIGKKPFSRCSRPSF